MSEWPPPSRSRTTQGAAMIDRELLELAAKAAGYEVFWHENWKCFVHTGSFNTDNPPTLAGGRMVWIPLDDDGDALRLAVRLGMEVYVDTHPDGCSCTEARSVTYSGPDGSGRFIVMHKSDPYAATRRAIVEAAAIVAKAQP